MSPYTKCPLTFEFGAAYAHEGNFRVLLADRNEVSTTPTERDANLRRAVACWNLCEGISTEQIERLKTGGLVSAHGFLADDGN